MKDVLGGGLMIVLALALVASAIVYVAGGGDGKWEFETRVVLDGTREEAVFWLCEPERRSQWVKGIQESQLLDADNAHEGARMREVFRIEGDLQDRAVEFVTLDPVKEIEMISTAPGFVLKETFSMTGTAMKTHIFYQAEITQEGLGFMLFEPIFAAGVNARLKNGLETLKVLMASPF